MYVIVIHTICDIFLEVCACAVYEFYKNLSLWLSVPGTTSNVDFSLANKHTRVTELFL